VTEISRTLQDVKRAATEERTALAAKLSAHEASTDLSTTKLDSQLVEATQRLSLQIVEAQEGLARRVDEVHDEGGRDRNPLRFMLHIHLQFNQSTCAFCLTHA
jgi:hypothetical protein